MIVTPAQLNQRAELYHQLGSLLTAGIPVLKALETLQRNPPHRSFREPLAALQATLDKGATMSEGVQELGRWIPQFDRSLIHAGEQSGRLDVTFKLLASYYHERAQLVRRVISDLLYPVFVFHFAIVLFPFIDWFKNSDTGLFLLRIAGVLGPLYLGIFLLIFACQGGRGELWRSMIERVLHPIPVLGTARRNLALARLAAALEALINAGVPIFGAWDLAAAASGSPALMRTVAQWKPSFESGRTPAEMLSESPEFPEMFANLYTTGEASGQIDDSLKRLQVYYQEEGSRKLHTVATWTPKLVYFAVVAFVVHKIFSFYTGYFSQLNQVMQ